MLRVERKEGAWNSSVAAALLFFRVVLFCGGCWWLEHLLAHRHKGHQHLLGHPDMCRRLL